MPKVAPAFANSVFAHATTAQPNEPGSNPFMPTTADVLAKYKVGFSLVLSGLGPASQTAVRSAIARIAHTSDPVKAEQLAQQALRLARQLETREKREKEDKLHDERMRADREERKHRTEQRIEERRLARRQNLTAIGHLRLELLHLDEVESAV